jgi:hypothetical protein
LCGVNYACQVPGGCTFSCQIRKCGNHIYQCGDCIDNDGDGRVDAADPDCTGPCKNTEVGLWGNISGQNNAPCKMDCFWDQDTGSGNDQCYWDHRCDPNEVSPGFHPEGTKCDYAGSDYKVQGNDTCADFYASQSSQCAAPANADAGASVGICSRVTPNGCDCFGCCKIPNAPTPVYLNSETAGVYTCTLADAAQPSKCQPCQQVPSCINDCGNCELCLGKTTLPPECGGVQTCPGGAQRCGLPGQPLCGAGFYCVTGCCQSIGGL